MFALRKTSCFLVLLLCSTPLALSGCSDSDEPDPISTIIKYLKVLTYSDKDELRDDVEIFKPTAADFERLNKKVLANPSNATIYRNRGKAYYYSDLPNRYKLALADLNIAISLFPLNARWYSDRSALFNHLERHDEAIKDIDKAILLDGSDSMFYSERANIYDDLGKPEEALKDHVKAAKVEKPAGMYSITLAKELAKRDRRGEALDLLNKVIARGEDYWVSDAHEERINILMCQGKFDQAQKEVSEWKGETPPTKDALKTSVKLIEVFGPKEKALDDYRELVKLSTAELNDEYSDHGSDYEDRAGYYDKLGESKKATEDRRKALAVYEQDDKEELAKDQTKKPQPTVVIENIATRAALYDKLGEVKLANDLRTREIAAQDVLVAKSPASADAYHDRGKVLEEQKKYELALRDYAKAMALQPNDNHFTGHHADCLNHLKRYQQAADECKNGLKSNSRYSEFVLGPLAEASERLGKHEDAVTYATSRIKIDSGTGDTYFWRSCAYEKLGKKDLAKSDLILSKWFESESDE